MLCLTRSRLISVDKFIQPLKILFSTSLAFKEINMETHRTILVISSDGAARDDFHEPCCILHHEVGVVGCDRCCECTGRELPDLGPQGSQQHGHLTKTLFHAGDQRRPKRNPGRDILIPDARPIPGQLLRPRII